MGVEWCILSSSKKKTIFLDRDGVINQQAAIHEYIKSWEEFHFLDGVPQAIAALKTDGYRICIITNQRGIARRKMTLEDVKHLHHCMCDALKKQGAEIWQRRNLALIRASSSWTIF